MGLKYSDIKTVAKSLSRDNNINVQFSGAVAYTDGSTINLPAFPDDFSDEATLTKVRAYLDHEVGHHVSNCDFGYFEQVKEKYGEPAAHLLGALEDSRTDRVMSEVWSNSGHNISKGMDEVLGKVKLPAPTTDAEVAEQVGLYAYCKTRGYKMPTNISPDVKRLGDELLSKLPVQQIADTADSTQAWDDAMKWASEHWEPPQQQQQQQPQPQPQGGDGDGDEDGESQGGGGSEGDKGEDEGQGKDQGEGEEKGDGQGGGSQGDEGDEEGDGEGQGEGEGDGDSEGEGQQEGGGGGDGAGTLAPPSLGDSKPSLASQALADKVKDDLIRSRKYESSPIYKDGAYWTYENKAFDEPRQHRIEGYKSHVNRKKMVELCKAAQRAGFQRIVRALQSEGMVRWRGGKRSGSVDPKAIAALAAGTTDTCMRKRTIHRAPKTACVLLLDGSGSMDYDLEPAAAAAYAFSTALSAARIQNCVMSFHGGVYREPTDGFIDDIIPLVGGTYYTYHPQRLMMDTHPDIQRVRESPEHMKKVRAVNQANHKVGQLRPRDPMMPVMMVQKGMHERLTAKALENRIWNRYCNSVLGGTPISLGVNAAMGELLRVPDAQRRVMIVFSDGDADDNAAAKREVDRCRAMGIQVVSVGISGGYGRRWAGDEHHTTASTSNLSDVTIRTLAKQLGH